MKASVSPTTLRFGAVLGAVACLWSGVTVSAQDVIVQKDNQRREGQIVGVADGKIKIKVGPVETSVALDQTDSVTMAPPAAFQTALDAWQSGDAAKTLSTLKPLVDTYRGLPTSWAERASALLGEVYLAQNDLANAEAAFAAFQKAYPASASLSEIGLARLAVAKNDFATAKQKLTPIVAAGEKILLPKSGESATYGQAFYLMGLVQESEGSNSEALKNYLTTVTVFFEDQAVVAKAQERAAALKEKQIIVP